LEYPLTQEEGTSGPVGSTSMQEKSLEAQKLKKGCKKKKLLGLKVRILIALLLLKVLYSIVILIE